ncbi:hypothetical protein [Hymenobacter arizonensis]|uniref:Auto-transporter adhesin head GIN domain-containing protein n=1 Tax=Hymenobacter arizonensis TaxID=1227077 RepID=A0A1I6AZY8_HYMAR|nr:hypothetical protein [Hymenobacter arizonensis]SFQ74230.1 hypothetical protein SAMN04515668_4105 [Hymenobacter arizonensis]
MKNSLKFLTAAGLLLLGSLTAYNAALRNEYRLGAYKNPVLNYDLQSQRNFRTVHLPGAGLLSARIEEGPFGVYVSKEAADFVRITQEGTELTVALNFAEEVKFKGGGNAVIIRCPRLDVLTASTTYVVNGRVEKKLPQHYPNFAMLVVQGFTQDSMRLVQDGTARVVLVNNHLGHLRASVGQSPGSTAQLDLNSSNTLASTDIRVDKRGKLNAENVALPKLRWQFGDSAQVTMSGAALASLAR